MSTLSFEEQKESLKDFCLMDDTLMQKVFKNNIEAGELLLQKITKRANLRVTSYKTQYRIVNHDKRSIRLDIWAVDDNGRVINVEVQKSNSGAHPRRARFNSSLIDAHISKKSMDFKDLPETFVVFITNDDVLKKGLQTYHIERVITECNEAFNDGTHIMYINSQVQDDTDLGKLMHDFHCKNPNEMYYKVLADKVRYLKESRKGVREMMTATEKLMAKGKAEGITIGVEKTKLEAIKNLMKNLKFSAEQAMIALDYSPEEQKKLLTML